MLTFQRLTLFGSIVLAANQLYATQLGNAFVSLFMAVCLGLNEIARTPDRAYYRIARRIGVFISTAAGLSRRLVLAIAIGGSVLIIDFAYDVNFLQRFEPLDDVLKRCGVSLLFVTIIVFIVALVNARVSRIAVPARDTILRNIELHYYVAAAVFLVSGLVVLIGLPIEDFVPSSLGDDNSTSAALAVWPPSVVRLLLTLWGIATVWMVAAGLALVSRSAELRSVDQLAYWDIIHLPLVSKKVDEPDADEKSSATRV